MKNKNANGSISDEPRVRVVTTEFSGTGINGHEGDTFVIAANVPAPPCLLQNSEAFDGPAPFGAIPYDQAAHESYTRANAPRVEPKPAITLLWTSAEVCAELAWSAEELRLARASGFPAPSGTRTHHDEDGVATHNEPLFNPEVVRAWLGRLRALPVGAR